MGKPIWVLCSLAAVLCFGWPLTVRGQLNGDNHRLPNNSYPLRYDLELTTYVHEDGRARQFRFDGKVKIEVFVKDERNSSITLHYRQTTITHVKLWSFFGNGTENVLLDDDSSFQLDPVREFISITPTGVDLKGTYFLELEYRGTLREDNAGFYRSSYVDDEGKTRWLATTQFSSTDARHAFPCYDEPGIRAPIGLTVIHGENYTVLSNNLPKESTPGPYDGYVKTVFEDTPVMQPYLLGIIVSDFASVSSPLYPRQRVFARYNAIRNGEGDFILEAGHKVLDVLEQYLQTDYALPKIYQVAVPDFAPGAMENYGLVTYKEQSFFYDSRSSPLRQKHAIATVVGHEFGHQYFGNMVSPAWWSYLWMKEGFARYFEYLASDIAYPEFRISETYSVEQMYNAFERDSLSSSRPMTYYVNTATEVANVFDEISYAKGGSMMRMFQQAFGPETFRQALINYLRSRAFQAAAPENFAEAIQWAIDNATDIALPENVTALNILKSWTEQSGFPVLHVSRDLSSYVHLTQERYLLKSLDEKGSSWIVPYNFATAKNPNFAITSDTRWLLTNSATLPAEGWTASDWIIFNKQQTGYYRVNYDERLWNLLITQLFRNHSIINNINRAQLIDDSLNLARSGRLGYDTALRLIAYLSYERDYVPWAAAHRNLLVLTRLFAGSAQHQLLERYFLSMINPVFAELGLETKPEDNLFVRRTRELTAQWACRMGSEQCLNESSLLLQQSLQSVNVQVDPDLRGVIYCHGLAKAGEDVFLAVWKRMQTSKDQQFRGDLISALGCTQSEALKELLLNTSIADEVDGLNYFGQERGAIFSAVSSKDREGTEIAIKFFANNMMKINELYNKGNFGKRAIGNAVTSLASSIVDLELNGQFQELIDQLSRAGLLRDADILRALEQTSENLLWVQTKGVEIEDWLQAFFPAPTTTTETPTTTTTTIGTTTVTPSPSTTTSTVPLTRSTSPLTTAAPTATTIPTTTDEATVAPTVSTTSEATITSTQERTSVTAALKTTTEDDGGSAIASVSNVVDTFPTIAEQKAVQDAIEKRRKMQNSLDALVDRRDLLLDKVLRINESLQAENISIHLLRLHLETLRRCADDYEKNYSEMSTFLPKEGRAEERKEYAAFEKLHDQVYVELQARISQTELTTKLLETQNPSVIPSSTAPPPVFVQTSVPHLQAPFPTFNGNPENWYSFKSLFQSIMARYVNESPAMKILYLRNSLSGDAKDKIDEAVVNNNDYESAWKILETAYEDKRLILDTHIDTILDCPRICKENRGKSLAKLVDICTKHTDALNSHGYPVEGLAELILVNVIYKKLDKETQEQWEVKIGHEDLPANMLRSSQPRLQLNAKDIIKNRSRLQPNRLFQRQRKCALVVKQSM
ncbi:aminopeptidase N-like [Sabethes cyaneus]|uniref:aminopeptidase N-like n=1 Tax=Sabethes cyaneus TaxID=53552 RepID=UPI00237E91B8|nr:aminopeptidase N-like [Sabethes cyaneus]